MSSYKRQEYDFIVRTKAILEQYETFPLAKEDKFEDTLFLNCLVGLIILPQQHWFENLPTDLISKKDWGIEQHQILYITETEIKSVDNIARHIRNSLAHYRFEVFGNHKGNISKIKFKDYYKNKKTFEATITSKNLKDFANKFSSYLTEEMEKQK